MATGQSDSPSTRRRRPCAAAQRRPPGSRPIRLGAESVLRTFRITLALSRHACCRARRWGIARGSFRAKRPTCIPSSKMPSDSLLHRHRSCAPALRSAARGSRCSFTSSDARRSRLDSASLCFIGSPWQGRAALPARRLSPHTKRAPGWSVGPPCKRDAGRGAHLKKDLEADTHGRWGPRVLESSGPMRTSRAATAASPSKEHGVGY